MFGDLLQMPKNLESAQLNVFYAFPPIIHAHDKVYTFDAIGD